VKRVRQRADKPADALRYADSGVGTTSANSPVCSRSRISLSLSPGIVLFDQRPPVVVVAQPRRAILDHFKARARPRWHRVPQRTDEANRLSSADTLGKEMALELLCRISCIRR
jgi:hypothetical protein